MEIKDSGERRSFDTGAVRDIQEGKGRPTLMPLQVAATILELLTGGDRILLDIGRFKASKATKFLYRALTSFAASAYKDSVETLLLEVSVHYEDGCRKYGEDNWRKGIPTNCYLDSAIRHYLKWRRGDKDEPHDRAFCWNLMCCIWEVDYHENKNSQN